MPLPVIGILHSGSQEPHGAQIAAFLRGLEEVGYIEGEDVTIRPTWADDDPIKLKNNATTLVGLPVALIVAAGGPVSAVAAQAATLANPIPIVFTTVADPVASGLVDSLDKPGKNLTGTAGLTSELDAKRVELLHELLPKLTQIGVLTNSKRPQFPAQFQELKDAAERVGILTLVQKDVTSGATAENDIDNAFNDFATGGVKAVLVTADPLFNNRRKTVVKAARNKKIPAIYQWREFVAAGGLMSYGPSINDAYSQAGIYAGRILDGEKPQNLPVILPNSFELVINLKTANRLRKDIGLIIPGSLLARAILLRRK
jgi:putative ABC transport system substrate-binding protein